MNPIADEFVTAVALARIARLVPRIADPQPSPVKGALLDEMLPSVHLLAIVAIMGQALEGYVEKNNIPWPRGKPRDLYNRIEVVAAIVPGIGRERLHSARDLRNVVAHPKGIGIGGRIDWASLDAVIAAIGAALVAIEVLDSVPVIDAGYERAPMLYPTELGSQGERIRVAHRLFATRGGETCFEYIHEVRYSPNWTIPNTP